MGLDHTYRASHTFSAILVLYTYFIFDNKEKRFLFSLSFSHIHTHTNTCSVHFLGHSVAFYFTFYRAINFWSFVLYIAFYSSSLFLFLPIFRHYFDCVHFESQHIYLCTKVSSNHISTLSLIIQYYIDMCPLLSSSPTTFLSVFEVQCGQQIQMVVHFFFFCSVCRAFSFVEKVILVQ